MQTVCMEFPILETFWGFFSNISNKRDETAKSIEKHSCSGKILLLKLLLKLLLESALLLESGLSGEALRRHEAS